MTITEPQETKKTNTEPQETDMTIIRKQDLQSMLGVSDPSIYRWEREGKFPKRLQLGGNSVGWLRSEVVGWVQARADARKGGKL